MKERTFEPMEAKLVAELPTEGRWQFEPKWDGFRCVAFRHGSNVLLQAKSGKPLTRYFPEIVAAIASIKFKHFVLDGELLIPIGKALSFDALQLRLHPAKTRIDRLAKETPALFIAFDLIEDNTGRSIIEDNLVRRRKALDALFVYAQDYPR